MAAQVPQLDFRESLQRGHPPSITSPLRAILQDIFLKFQKLLQETKEPFHAIHQVARPSQAGAYLPGGFPYTTSI